MKTKISPAIVGLFVIGGLVITIVSLLSLGGLHLFAQPQRFVVYFDETIHGLDLGSPVKLRGVRVGRVVNINVRYDDTNNRSVVGVVCELSRNVITDARGNMLDVTDRAALERLVTDGLGAQLGVIGLATGLLYVELDFHTEALPPPSVTIDDARYVILPAAPSAIAAFQAGLTEVLADIQRMDLPGVAAELKGLLATTRTRIDGLDTVRLAREWTEAGTALKTLAQSPEIPQALGNLNATLTDLRRVLATLDGEVGPTTAELRATLAQAKVTLDQFSSTAIAARRFVSANSQVGDEATRALQQLSEAADAIRRLADFLERNPSSLLTGRQRGDR